MWLSYSSCHKYDITCSSIWNNVAVAGLREMKSKTKSTTRTTASTAASRSMILPRLWCSRSLGPANPQSPSMVTPSKHQVRGWLQVRTSILNAVNQESNLMGGIQHQQILTEKKNKRRGERGSAKNILTCVRKKNGEVQKTTEWVK